MRFAVDCMLGKLAKWLKILGFDTLYFSRIEDDELLSIAQDESRILLTRDTGLLDRARTVQSLFIEDEDWKAQIGQVIRSLNLRDRIAPFSRCIDCNEFLKTIPRAKARNLVTPFIFERADSFAVCRRCGRVFWKGTHYKDMETKIKTLLGDG